MVFKIKLAENIIKIESLYERVFNMCKEYIVEKECVAAECCDINSASESIEACCGSETEAHVDIFVKITAEDIENEREKSSEDGIYSDAYLETLAVYRKIAVAMVEKDIFLMHGAVFAIGDAACMITAPSGTGKTTFLRQMYKVSDDAYIVNGDKPLIGVDKSMDEVYAYGTPWSGKENLNTNSKVPLKMICILRRGEENSMEEIEFSAALPTLLSQSYRPENAQSYIKTIGLIGELKDRIKFYNLNMKMYDTMKEIETVAAEMVKEKMS